jgi:pyruvate kinase
MTIRTKIICTIGPSCNTLEMMMELMRAGMNVARLNFSHGTQKQHLEVIEKLKEARNRLKKPLAIMLDTKGPEIRIGTLKQGQASLTAGQKWLLVKEAIEGDQFCVSINPSSVVDCLSVGDRILFDDGYLASKVVEITPKGVIVSLENSGIIRSGKGVNVPGVNLNLPIITASDIDDIRFGCRHDIDIIAASFVRCADHVLAIRKLLEEENKHDIMIVAKIENREGVQNFDSIVPVADGIMIARGDLGVEVPLSEVPRLQKMMIRKSYLAGKPAVTATQMLESMINNPRPTRAEVSDVANAIYDSSSAVMLSGETAIGQYPLEVVKVMKSIIKQTEADFDYQTFFKLHADLVYNDVPSAVTLATVKTAYTSNAKAIFAFTSSGTTARLISRLRPMMPIIALTSCEKSYNQMSFNWGVTPFYSQEVKTMSEAFSKTSAFALENNLVSYGDLVVVAAGSPFGICGTTNMMMVESIGEVLVRGDSGFGPRVHGNVALVLSPESRPNYLVRGQLLVIAKCDASYFPLINDCLGVILQNHIDDRESEQNLLEMAHALDKPYVVRADAATRILKEGQLVTLDTEKALVYKGVVL